ncbi:MAG TPA: FtsQ-type POTRA domain-containing protein [Gaiellaceae bacterium]
MGRLALVQPRSVRDGLAVPWRRAALVTGVAVAVLLLLYVAARETAVFAVRTVEISGASPDVRRAVRTVTDSLEGQSLVSLDGGKLIRELEALPSVRSATYDRAFPNTLRLFITPEPPVGVVHLGSDRWVLSARGRVIAPVPAGSAIRLPQFHAQPAPEMKPGAFVTDPRSQTILSALALVPKDFPSRIYSALLVNGELTFNLRAGWGRPELRLGEPVDIGAKLAAAGLVLRSIAPSDRGSVGYLDVSIPERVVVGPIVSTLNSQVEPETLSTTSLQMPG